MSMTFGDVNLPGEIIELTYRVNRSELLFDRLLQTGRITQSDVKDAEEKSLKATQSRFPNMGIKKK